MSNPLLELQRLGQSIWNDNIRRSWITAGEMQKMVTAGEIVGVTSNPTIFEKAIDQSDDYDAALHGLIEEGRDTQSILEALMIADIQMAADVLREVYERTQGRDGYVSIEVSPRLAYETQGTIAEALRLRDQVGRPNLMVKVPATPEGIPAIQRLTAEGVNVNITLIFSLELYRQVMEAYLSGLEEFMRRRPEGRPPESVASFFVSRVDTLTDSLLDAKIREIGEPEGGPLHLLRGQAAIANAKLAYAMFRQTFVGPRWEALRAKGAHLQRPLWASTSTKNPAYPDVYYVEALIGPDTVNTLPPATLDAYRDHGQPAVRVDRDVEEAQAAIDRLAEAGIAMDDVTRKLLEDGVAAFARSYETLLASIERKRQTVFAGQRQRGRASLGPLAGEVSKRLGAMDDVQWGTRLWAKDPVLWTDDASHHSEIMNRLGWLTVVEPMRRAVPEIRAFADEARAAGFTRALLLGMGGSLLAPEVLRETFGMAAGYLDLAVLDSTAPAAVRAADRWAAAARTLFLVSSKSGGTVEVTSFLAHFWERSRDGGNFIAITDPDTSLAKLADERGFRRAFLNPPDIGGRYSALSYFGLVPAALVGIDIEALLARASAMARACGPEVPAHDNPGLWLGAALGEAALAGRDKVTLICSEPIRTFGYWAEQLIAESTGKQGRGIIPVEGEPLGPPQAYGPDRLFVYLRMDAALDRAAARLEEAGHPVVWLDLAGRLDLGAEFFRWEMATAVAGAILRVNAFDQPDVQQSKDNTARLLAEYEATGRLPKARGVVEASSREAAARLAAHLRKVKAGDYVALTAYVQPTGGSETALRSARRAIRDRLQVATTAGYGPRFLHSTGQLHKGGPANGVFIQITAGAQTDLPVPGQTYTFAALEAAQALGDLQSLQAGNRRVLRLQFARPGDLRQLPALVREALAITGAGRARRQRSVRKARR